MSSHEGDRVPVPPQCDQQEKVGKHAGVELLRRVFAIELVLWILLSVVRVAVTGAVGSVLSILIGVATYWAVPYAYLGRAYSLREDLHLTKAVRTHDALSGQDIPLHPPWWKESGEPGRTIIRIAVLGTVPLSAVAAAFPAGLAGVAAKVFPHHQSYLPVEDGQLPTLTWGVCWMAGFAALYWARSTRRKAFRARVDALVERENLQPHLSERVRLSRVNAELARQEVELRDIVSGLKTAYAEAGADGVPPGIRVSLDRLVTHARTAAANQETLLKKMADGDARIAADSRNARHREWLFAVGGIVAGLLLSVLSHQVGLT